MVWLQDLTLRRTKKSTQKSYFFQKGLLKGLLKVSFPEKSAQKSNLLKKVDF